MNVKDAIYNFAAGIDYEQVNLKYVFAFIPVISQLFMSIKVVSFYRDVNTKAYVINYGYRMLQNRLKPLDIYKPIERAGNVHQVGTIVRGILILFLTPKKYFDYVFTAVLLDTCLSACLNGLANRKDIKPKSSQIFVPPPIFKYYV